MAQPPGYPPAPPGGYPPPGADPYAAERALAEWAAARGYTLGSNPDMNWYQAWSPFIYFMRLGRLGRELKGQLGDASVHVVEGFEADSIKQAAGEDRYVCAFLMSPRLTCRVAIRSKSGGGVINEMKSGFGSLFSGKSAGSVLGDQAFESRFDVTTPAREEGQRALPIPLRQYLMANNWRGILETRPGGMVCAMYDRKSFDVPALEWTLATLGYLYQLASG